MSVRGRRDKSSTRKNRIQPESLSLMTPKTKDFIQKICYKKTASVDMTKYGFITESKMGPINVYVKPLREQIQKIVETANTTKETTPPSRRRAVPSSAGLPSDSEQPDSLDSINKFIAAKARNKSVVFSL